MQLTMNQFEAVMPSLLRPESWLRPIVEAMGCFEIDTPARAAAFLAQVAHESNQCRNTEESLSFSAATLMHTWPRRFPTLEIAMKYERNPEMTANYVYANRLGNGDVESGDGFLFRGRGLIHIAGRSNYAAASDALGVDFLVDPDAMAEPAHAALSAAWFWQTRGLNQNHNRVLKNVFKSAATAAIVRPGPLQDFYQGMIARGMREELARVTLARKVAAVTLRVWKRGERFDPAKLTVQAR